MTKASLINDINELRRLVKEKTNFKYLPELSEIDLKYFGYRKIESFKKSVLESYLEELINICYDKRIISSAYDF